MRGQISLFDGSRPFEIEKPVRLIELFAGIGAQAKAIERLGIACELYKVSEWDVFANCSYRAVHCKNDTADHSAGVPLAEVEAEIARRGISCNGKDPLAPEKLKAKPEAWKRAVYSNMIATNNIGSIVNASAADLGITETDKFVYFVTYSFPCQDLSLAGKRRGMKKGSGTRSGLLWEFERILRECKELPQVLLMENVTQVCGKKNADAFAEWLDTLDGLGYRNYYQVQNALDYGVPQNRERCFMVSLLGDFYFEFPTAQPLERCVLDYLEEKVPDKYYLSKNDLEVTLTSNFKSRSDISGGGTSKPY